MPEHQAVDIEHVPIVTPPPYMDPANAQAKKKMSRIRKESVSNMKPCQHCGAPPQAQAANLPHEQGTTKIHKLKIVQKILKKLKEKIT